MECDLTDLNWVTCLLHIYANGVMIVLFFCFERCNCLPPCCCHYFAALLVVTCSTVAPVSVPVLGTSLLSSLPTYCFSYLALEHC
jgi:hypothetical protein